MNKKIIAAVAAVAVVAIGIFAFFPKKDEEKSMKNNTVTVLENISYGTHARNTLNLAFPADKTGDIGLVLFIHGGAWVTGDKSEYDAFIRQYAEEKQVACAAMNYRFVSDSVHIGDILADIHAALGKIRSVSAEKGLQISKVLLTGTSAGAHLSMLYAYRCKDIAPVKPAAVFSFCGPTDLYDDQFYVSGSLGTAQEVCSLMSDVCGQAFTLDEKETAKDALDAASPILYVSADICPTALCHGKKDSVVPYSNAMSILSAFEKHGVQYDFISFPNSDHDLARDPDCMQQAYELLGEYMEKYLR